MVFTSPDQTDPDRGFIRRVPGLRGGKVVGTPITLPLPPKQVKARWSPGGFARYGGDSASVQAQLTGVESIASTAGAFAAQTSEGKVVTWGDARWGGDSASVQAQLTGVESIASTNFAFAAQTSEGNHLGRCKMGRRQCFGASAADASAPPLFFLAHLHYGAA